MATRKSKNNKAPSVAPPAPALAPTPCPIVGIGASAGGLEAFEIFFHACPADNGMAYVLVPHLDPGHESLLTEILQRATEMPVMQATDLLAVAPDHVYIIPPNREMSVFNGVLHLHTPDKQRGQRMPIDTFMRSLAEDQSGKSIGIILSGTATDGTEGLRAILGAGGVCMVQDPTTAQYDGMPQSAIQAGFATHILPVAEMPSVLRDVIRKAAAGFTRQPVRPEKVLTGITRILQQLRSVTGHDFSLYKKSTICRRIERRMTLHGIDDTMIYAQMLKENPAEIQKLFKELLINVTSFFRDPDAFSALKNTILPPLLKDKPDGYVFRVWIPGCATGEEAYSIAIVLRELLDELKSGHDPEMSIQIYATDLDEEAIAVARAGRYPPNIAQDVSPERLQRFFAKEETGFKVKQGLRDMVVFAVQSVIKDPPFTRLDLLSCRNLMIYLELEQQNRLIPTFHYALKPGGVLFLSPSESITSRPDLFSPLDRKWKLYSATHSASSIHDMMANCLPWTGDSSHKTPENVMKHARETNFEELTRHALLHYYAPASVITDMKGSIQYVYGDTGRYLRPAPGPMSNNVVDMAREGLQFELGAFFRELTPSSAPILDREVMVKTNGHFTRVSFSVRHINTSPVSIEASTDSDLLLMSFQDVTQSGAPAQTADVTQEVAARIEQLERELAYAREGQRASTAEQQAIIEELKSTNEELQSTNEELQSSNEELLTSKEELQSLNEEMVTVNSELNARIEQLSEIQNDMKNLLDGINTGCLFLDQHLIIRRYTAQVLNVFRLIASDLGRPLTDIKSNLETENLQDDLQRVLDSLIPIERELRTIDGTWYLVRIQPYRTLDNVIAGVVLTFTDVTAFKFANESVLLSKAQLETAQEIAHLGCWELDLETGSLSCSPEVAELFGFESAQPPGSLQDLMQSIEPEDRPLIEQSIQDARSKHGKCSFKARIRRTDGSLRIVHALGRPIAGSGDRVTRLAGTLQDISTCTPEVREEPATCRSEVAK
jgi:two-component system CheB/CheR fusion protein